MKLTMNLMTGCAIIVSLWSTGLVAQEAKHSNIQYESKRDDFWKTRSEDLFRRLPYGPRSFGDSITQEESLMDQRKWRPNASRRDRMWNDRNADANARRSPPPIMTSAQESQHNHIKAPKTSLLSQLSESSHSSTSTSNSFTTHASPPDSVHLAWMSYYASDLIPSWDNAYDAVADRLGNIYAIGMTDSTLSHTDFLTIKYSPSGTVLWKRRWTSEFSNIDIPNAMDIDTAGNIYITGQSFTPSSAYDFITLKYNSDGDLLWAKRYDSPEHGSDIATSIAVDSSGNVYVGGGGAGGGFGVGGDYDYLTIKYGPDGSEEWVRRYDGASGFLDDGINALAVDAEGSVYVTGFSNSAQSPDVATIKYGPDGTELYVSRYDGPAGGLDEAYAISVNKWGNAFVTGKVATSLSFQVVDILTIKYDLDGSEEWINHYDGSWGDYDYAAALAADDSGNVYVGGSLDVASTFATIKYNAIGSIQWIMTEGTSYGRIKRLTIDGTGNIIVAGGFAGLSSFGTMMVKYQPNGVKLWAVLSDTIIGNGLAVDPEGNVTIAGTTGTINETQYDQAMITRKYTSSGVKQWEDRVQGIGWSNDWVRGMKVDQEGNTYLAINAEFAPNEAQKRFDLVLLKLSADGDTIWTRKRENVYIAYWGAVFDSLGGAFIAASRGLNIDSIVALKYDPNGNLLWSESYSRPNYTVRPQAAGMDEQGNCYIGIEAQTGNIGTNFLLKYSPSGTFLWQTENLPTESFNMMGELAIDRYSNITMTGYRSAVSRTMMWDTEGKKKWLADGNASTPQAITVDDSGGVCITGLGMTTKYTQSGVSSWTKSSGGFAIASDKQNNVYCVNPITKYNSNGEVQWTQPDGSAYAIKVDNCGNVYTAGEHTYYTPYENAEISVMKLNPSGEIVWQKMLRPLEAFSPRPFLEVDCLGQVYVGGNVVIGIGRMSASYVAKLIQVPSLQVSETIVSFGSVPLGCTNEDTIMLESSVCTAADGFLLSSSNPDVFTLVPLNASPNTEQASVLHQYAVRFHPQTAGPVSAILTLSHRLSEAAVTLNVNGTGIVEYPHYSVSNLPYEATPVGCRRTETFTIQNKRCEPLEIQLLVPEELSEAHFDFTVEPSQATIPGQDSILCTVTFMPLAVGTRSATLILAHNQSASPDSLVLTGVGTGSGSEHAVTQDFGSTDWHLISLPVIPSPCSYQLPGSYFYQNGYQREDTLSVGKGYWNKLTRERLSFAGEAVSEISIPVKRKWNIIGSISMPVAVSEIQSVPAGIVVSNFYGFTGSGYVVTDTIVPGKAYWVKASEDAQLILSATPSSSTADSEAEGSGETEGSRKVLLSSSASSSIASALMRGGRIQVVPITELPPPPPSRSLDISEAENADETDRNKKSITQYPTSYSLEQNYPNPFNPVTQIRYAIPEDVFVILKIFNVLGQEVQTLINDPQKAGFYTVSFDGALLPTGIYICRLDAGSYHGSKKIVLMR